MFWTPHMIIGIIVSALLYPIYGLNVLIILISNILIDADHYLWYIWIIKDKNLVKAFKFYKNRNIRLTYGRILHIFHTAEILSLIIILNFYYKFFFFILIGIVIHLILDIIYEFNNEYCRGLRFWSFLEYLITKIVTV